MDVAVVDRVRELITAKEPMALSGHLGTASLPPSAVVAKAHPVDGLSAFLFACSIGAGVEVVEVLLGG